MAGKPKLTDNATVEAFAQWLAEPRIIRMKRQDEDPDYPVTQKDFANYHRITEQTLCNWKRDKRVQKMKQRFQREMAGDDLPEILNVMIERSKDGDIAHINTYLKYLGELVDKHQVNITNDTIEVLLSSIVEIIQEEVKDAETVNRIAARIGELDIE